MKRLMLLAAVLAAVLICAGCNKDDGTAPVVKLPGVSKNVATVDGLNITSKEYQVYLSDNFGEQALNALIREKILEKWAEDLKVKPTEEEINKTIEQLKEGPGYKYQSMMTEPDVLDKQIKKMAKQQALLVNIAKKLAPAKDTELKKMYEDNKADYQKPAAKEYTLVALGPDKDKAEEAAKPISETADENALRSKILELKKDNEHVQAFPGMSADVLDSDAAIKKVAEALKPGEWSKVSKMTPNDPNSKDVEYYIISFKQIDKVDKSFDDVKDELEARVSLSKVNQNNEFQKKLEERTTNADIKILIPDFADVAEKIKTPEANAQGMY